MKLAPEGMLSVTDFAQRMHIPPNDVIVKLKAGQLAGRVVENDWYVEHVELGRLDANGSVPNRVTAIMLAAANLHWREILDAIDERRKSPIKADTPEHGLNVARIHVEAKLARRRAIGFDIVIGIAALVGMVLVYGSPPSSDDIGGGSSVPLLALALVLLTIAIADLFSRRVALRRVRDIFKTLANGRASNGVDGNHARNVVISGGYSPFVGAGVDAGGWSFTVNLTEPENAGVPVGSAHVKDLYEETAASLNKLAIPAMAIKDEAFVDGRDVRGLPLLTPSGPYARPCSEISSSDMAILVGSNEYVMRHYKVTRLELWDGQLILSIFFRYTSVGGTLYVESKTLILRPLLDRFSNLQNVPIVPVRRELLRDALWSVLRSPFIWIPVVLAAIRLTRGDFIMRERRWYKSNKKEVEANQKYNYGWTTSLREAWAGDEYNRYFQMADRDFYGKMVQEALLDSLLKSMERRNISTEGMKDASTKIYNEGVIISGGTVQADSIAAGKRARSTVKKALQAAAGVREKSA